MPWNDYPLTELTIPGTAGDADPRIVIGPDIPAELQAFYIAQRGEPVAAAILYYTSATSYYYEADLTSIGSNHAHGRGMASAGVVHEYEFLRYESLPNALLAYQGLFEKLNLVIGPDGTPDANHQMYIGSAMTLAVAGPLIWGQSTTEDNEVDPTGTTTSNAYVSTLTGAGAVPVTTDFAAPPSGQVTVSWRATGQVSASFGAVSPQISLSGGGAVVVAATDNRAIQFNSTVQMGFGATSLITGLTPGTFYTVTLFHRCAVASTFTLLRREVVVSPAL